MAVAVAAAVVAAVAVVAAAATDERAVAVRDFFLSLRLVRLQTPSLHEERVFRALPTFLPPSHP